MGAEQSEHFLSLTIKSVSHVVVILTAGVLLLLLLLHQQVGTSGTRRFVVVLLGDSDGGDDLRVGIVGVEGQRISSANFQRHRLSGRYRLEHVHHVVVGVAQNALIHHVDKNIAYIRVCVCVNKEK